MKLVCHTNLDLERCEKWPTELPEYPRVGDLIESGYLWPYSGGRRIELSVVRVRWVYYPVGTFCHLSAEENTLSLGGWFPHVELHLPPSRFQSLKDFYDWYGRLTGKGRGAYI